MRPAQVTIRPARADELDAAGALVAEVYRAEHAIDDASGYLAFVRDARGRSAQCEVLVAVDGGGALLGCVSYVPDHDNPYTELELPGEAGFRMLGVAPAAQGRGVGRALVAACIERAREAGRRGLAISTGPDWAPARRLYERLGFERAPERDFEPVPGVLLWAYVLAL